MVYNITSSLCFFHLQQAGFNAGDGLRFFNIKDSRTPAIIDVDTQSNTAFEGRFMFRIDMADVQGGGCNTEGQFSTIV